MSTQLKVGVEPIILPPHNTFCKQPHVAHAVKFDSTEPTFYLRKQRVAARCVTFYPNLDTPGPTPPTLRTLQLPNLCRVTQLTLSRNGALLLANCSDRVVRMFDVTLPGKSSKADAATAIGTAAASSSSPTEPTRLWSLEEVIPLVAAALSAKVNVPVLILRTIPLFVGLSVVSCFQRHPGWLIMKCDSDHM